MPQYEMPINSCEAQERFNALDSFTQGYIEAALEGEEIEHFGGLRRAAFDDLAPGTVARMVADCADFQQAAGAMRGGYQAGVDFWLTRNGLSPVIAPGDKLTELAHGYGLSDLYVGDDGRIYVT